MSTVSHLVICTPHLARKPTAAPDAAELVALLHASDVLHLDEAACGDAVRRHVERARTTVGELIARGVVPAHLAVREDEPPVVVERTLLAAWRHLRGRGRAERGR